MDKSLAPLIAVIALVIFLSFIIMNSDLIKVTETGKNSKLKNVTPEVKLRPGSNDYLLKGQNSNAAGEASQIIDIEKTFSRAKNLLAENKTKEAEDTLRTLLVFNPDHSQALSLLGGILFYSNRYAEAELIFRKQILLDPNNHLAYNRLGSTLAKQKKYNEGIENSSIAVGINPESGKAHINLAGMYSVVGKKEKAIKHFKEAYRILKYAILPLSFDETFDNIRNSYEFQDIIAKAQQNREKEKALKKQSKIPIIKLEE